MQATNAGIGILFWPEIAPAYPCKPKILPLLAEVFGLFPLVVYNCWQTVKTDALGLFGGVGTANYSTNNHRSNLHSMNIYTIRIYTWYHGTWYTNMADGITCTSYDVSCKGSIDARIVTASFSSCICKNII